MSFLCNDLGRDSGSLRAAHRYSQRDGEAWPGLGAGDAASVGARESQGAEIKAEPSFPGQMWFSVKELGNYCSIAPWSVCESLLNYY